VSLLVHTLTVLADPVNNPAPVDPTGGSTGVNLLLSYTKWGVLIACAVVALASGGFMAIGALSHRPDNVDKGKRALIWSIIGVVASACAIPLVNTVFGAAG
jgi:hypothetical protein